MSVSGRGLKITIVPSKHSGHCMCHLFQYEKEPVFSLQSECLRVSCDCQNKQLLFHETT